MGTVLQRYLITTLAEYQTRFWLEIGLELRRRGHEVLFLSFDSRSNEMLQDAGLDFADGTASARDAALRDQPALEVCRRFGIAEPIRWLTHEKFAFDMRDSDALLRKLAGTILVAHEAMERFAKSGRFALVQELGGFLSVCGTHFAALERGVESWFIEPSFFRGRMLFIEGGIEAFRLPQQESAPIGAEVSAYLAETLERGLIVIPDKDRHQYTTAFRKVVNLRNFTRLAQKLVDKHLLRKQQEFGHIGSHVGAHARMIMASRRLTRHYTPLPEMGEFVYFPLHVPGDVALTMRSPEYLDQIALIDYLCRVTPLRYRVAVKEHPAMIGAMGAERLLDLKQRYDRFAILPPSTNNFEVLREAAAVVTVNSKSGAEAGLLGQRVIVLGDAFYSDAPFSLAVDRLADLGRTLADLLSGNATSPSPEDVRGFFGALWGHTFPGELYTTERSNLLAFTDSLLAGTSPTPVRGVKAASAGTS